MVDLAELLTSVFAAAATAPEPAVLGGVGRLSREGADPGTPAALPHPTAPHNAARP
ncbi:hypothetical protein FRACA_540012 [Frankia canadensis]|uniref:Uncharacterized protein n=1 Tax=Frankia canadensis TaxID=1836972 RepID=A0A2I2KYU6_9ACTN|nr:hypothetical protein FRACA_540012 [Frankia canadensis]SOU58116.1 hypothetical protein FRACA_540012 [Frankia canadensis]